MADYINSLTNQQVKLVVSLKQKKYRDETGLFVVEGVRLAEEAAASSYRLAACFYTRKAINQERGQALVRRLTACCRTAEVSEEVYQKMTDTEQPQGIMVLVEKKVPSLSELLAGTPQPLLAVLDSVQDPGNVGTLIRTADAAGCSGVLVSKGCADIFAAKTVRAAMGSLFHLPVLPGVELTQVLPELKQRGIAIMATALTASHICYQVDFKEACAIVFGNEANGITPSVLATADRRIHIPLQGQAESLNVAASAAVILYEALRQRRYS